MPREIGQRAPRQTVQAGDRSYVVVRDLVAHDQLIVAGQVIDGLTGEGWRGPFSVRAVAGDAQRTKVGRDGFFAVAGDPQIALPLLATQSYSLEIALSSLGFRTVTRMVAIPAGAALPLPALTIPLSHLPITLAGRVVEATTARPPIANARVEFVDAELLLLRTPLHADHPAGVEVHAVHLNLAGPAKALTAGATRGATSLALTNTAGLAAGSLLRLGPERRYEVAVVQDLAAVAGGVVLTTALTRTFAPGTAVQPVDAVDLPADSVLDAEVVAGGGVLTLAAGVAAGAVRIRPLADPELEIHVVGAVTDADGFFQVDGIDRPRLAAVRASAAGFLTGDAAWSPDFRTGINRLDFALET